MFWIKKKNHGSIFSIEKHYAGILSIFSKEMSLFGAYTSVQTVL